jgi:hypothetical protein
LKITFQRRICNPKIYKKHYSLPLKRFPQSISRGGSSLVKSLSSRNLLLSFTQGSLAITQNCQVPFFFFLFFFNLNDLMRVFSRIRGKSKGCGEWGGGEDFRKTQVGSSSPPSSSWTSCTQHESSTSYSSPLHPPARLLNPSFTLSQYVLPSYLLSLIINIIILLNAWHFRFI